MRINSLITLVLTTFSAVASAVELMKWERIPLPISLNVGQERIIFVDKNVRVGVPPTLKGKLRVQSSGGAVYLAASEAFPVSRLQLQNKVNGEIILLDVSAAQGKLVSEPVQLVYEVEVSSVSTSDSGQQSDAKFKRRTSRKLNAPIPVVLTRYAAQSLYGPLRTVEALPGISSVTHNLPSHITTLYPSESVAVSPLASWSLNSYSVIALQVRNTAAVKIMLDPRALQGQFVSATFQHRWLGHAGTPEDTTVLYLVVRGRPDKAFRSESIIVTDNAHKTRGSLR
ncbi:TIGR03749 family integrating conjugative element protein [Yersinia aldovae]|uniref:Integrating conjugative element protein, PFL_4704 family n=1 Tax=Yersinia aldovae TaxID=29483 RepID=A0ABP1YTM9_YERAL|nr:TIGR03749 family integrating conjugative element protein [Yersinia aldovae]CNL42373.1 integrating conjugative element protein%2C PFL_4704 family [Yersinia aldovae]